MTWYFCKKKKNWSHFLLSIFWTPFFQGCKPTNNFKTRMMGTAWLGDWLCLSYLKLSREATRPTSQLVYDRNQVLVSETETKVSFGYWHRGLNFFVDFFPYLGGGYEFWKAWDWTQIYKSSLKIFDIWPQIGGPVMMKEIPHTIGT